MDVREILGNAVMAFQEASNKGTTYLPTYLPTYLQVEKNKNEKN
jgi:hypothetical protein